ncbi:hypothetical protein, partial [Pseudomonas savastanoi]|uniref:hypothetical protein n=3 Tax=Pseudomonas savastanoi TaxID=29438 RepID=UPI001F2F8BAB
MGLRNLRCFLREAQVQGVKYDVTGLDLRDQVPAHLAEVLLDGLACPLQRPVNPFPQLFATLANFLARAFDVARLALPAHHAVSLEHLEEGQRRASSGVLFEVGRRRRDTAGKVQVDLALDDGLQRIEHAQCVPPMARGQLWAADQRQKSHAQAAETLKV